jgi:hypothetical protein
MATDAIDMTKPEPLFNERTPAIKKADGDGAAAGHIFC